MKRFAENHPVPMALSLLLIVVLIRMYDVYILRSDELFGEQLLTKIGGLLLVIAYVWAVKGRLGAIGLQAERWLFCIVLGVLVMAAGLFAGYAAEWLTLFAMGSQPGFSVAPEGYVLIPGTTPTGGLFTAFVLLAGNVVNSFMEEGLFRGVLITHLGSRMSLGRANVVQAVIFAVWHIMWPIRDYLDGKIDLTMMLATSAGYLLVSGLVGFAWGYLLIQTNSLWTSWAAHLLNNSVMNFLHLTTPVGDPGTLVIRVLVVALTVVALLPLVRRVSRGNRMPEFKSWV